MEEYPIENLGHLYDLLNEIFVDIILFGVDKNTMRRFQERYSELGEVFCRESGIPKEKASGLPRSTPLGKNAKALAQELFREFQ